MFSKPKTIFVSVASYRDFYCSRTLESIFQNAQNPQSIFVGLCIQNDEKDEDCILSNPKLTQYNTNVATIRLDHFEAKGPTWARYLCTTLFNHQDYFLQIDSHTLFEKNWDTTLINMVDDIKKNTQSKDVILSHYPPSYEDYENKNKNMNHVDTICRTFFNDDGILSFEGAEALDMKKHKYVQTGFIAAGMFFCEGKCLKDVPYDPYLPNLFVGEEILHSARCWTAGYDIYTPNQVTVYHLYTRSDQPHIWDDKKTYNEADALTKVKAILKFEGGDHAKIPKYVNENIEKYGLGTKRTLQEYYKFIGVDLKNKKVNHDFCKGKHVNEGFSNYESGDKERSYYDILWFAMFVLLFLLILLFLFFPKKFSNIYKTVSLSLSKKGKK